MFTDCISGRALLICVLSSVPLTDHGRFSLKLSQTEKEHLAVAEKESFIDEEVQKQIEEIEKRR